MDDKLPDGISFFDKFKEQANFVVGAISINPERLIPWLQNQTPNEKGYVMLQVLRAKDTNKPYVKLDNWKPQQTENASGKGEAEVGGVPF